MRAVACRDAGGSWQAVQLPSCGASAKRRNAHDADSETGIWKVAHAMRNSVACRLHPESHEEYPPDDATGDASTRLLLPKTLTIWPEAPTATIGNIHLARGVAGSKRNGFSLKTTMMITGVSVLLAAAGTATTICTLSKRSPSKTASKVKGTTVGAGVINKPGTKSSASPMSQQNPNAAGASLLAGGQSFLQGSVRASAEANSSADDRNTWQVVVSSTVRSDSCLNCKAIGMKDRCIMVSGRREGDWIRLLSEPGYMLAVANGSALLQKSEVSYSIIRRGTCAEHGLYPITDDISCKAAARSIGFPDLDIQVIRETPKPEGCHMLGFTLWMSINPQNKGHGVMGHRQPLCSSCPTPVADPCQKIPKLKPSSPKPPFL